MAVEIIYQSSRNVTIFLVKGAPSVADLLRAYREAKETHGLTKHTVWDAREATLEHFSKHDLSMLNSLIALIQGAGRERVGGRSALLLSNPGDADKFSDYARLNFRLPQLLQVVCTQEEADAWVEHGTFPAKRVNRPS